MSDADEGWSRPDHVSGDAAYRPDADPWNVSSPWQPPNGAWPGRTYSSLAGLAKALQVLLPLVAVADAALVAALFYRYALLARFDRDPGSVSPAELNGSDATVGGISAIALLLMIATAAVFIVWFYRARTNADVFGGRYQRRARGWAIGGWFCPIVNLWFPYQIATDVLYEAESAATVPAGQQQVTSGRPSYPLLRGWWILLLLSAALDRVGWGLRAENVHALLSQTRLGIAATLLEIAAAILAVVVVRRITAAHERLKDNVATSPPWGGMQ